MKYYKTVKQQNIHFTTKAPSSQIRFPNSVPRSLATLINFITSWAVDIIRSSYYILGPRCNGINFAVLYVTQWWAIHVVI